MIKCVTTFMGMSICAALLSAAAPAPSDIALPDARAFPESLSAGPDGTLYIGSTSKGVIYRALPGETTASVWISKDQGKFQGVFGVLADSTTLWVCSTAFAAPGGPPATDTALKSFDLATGKPKGSYKFPSGGFCNDIAIAKDGTAYATDLFGGQVMRLKPGASALDVWIKDAKLAAIDGIAVLADGAVYVNLVSSNALLRIKVGADGSAGAIEPLAPSRPLKGPDGMRALGANTMLLIDDGTLSKVTIDGDKAQIDNIKTGLNTPTAVALVKNVAYVTEAKLNYQFDASMRDKDPGPFRIVAIPYPGR